MFCQVQCVGKPYCRSGGERLEDDIHMLFTTVFEYWNKILFLPFIWKFTLFVAIVKNIMLVG